MKLDKNEPGSSLNDKYLNINYLPNYENYNLTNNQSNEAKNEQFNNRLVKDRRSFYDNHEWTGNVNIKNDVSDESDEDKSNSSCFAECQTIENKLERDDFDDLIDLTHRVPRKVFKSESFKKVNNGLNSAANTTLPPLPFSFVKIENNHNTNFKNTRVNSANSSPHMPKGTTRLIIPVGSYEQENDRKITFKTLGEVLRENSTNNNKNIRMSSQPNSPYFKTKQVKNVNLSEPASPLFYHKKPTFNNNNNNNNLRISQKPSSKENLKTRPELTSKFNVRSKSSDVNKDWDQITKIFASLESLLNEVVDNTCHSKPSNRLSSSNGRKSSESKSIPTTPVGRKSKQQSSSTKSSVSDVTRFCSPPRQNNSKYANNSTSQSFNQTGMDFLNDNQRLLSNTSSRTADKQSLDLAYSSSSSCASSTQFNLSNNNKPSLDYSIYSKMTLKHIELIDFLKRANLRKYEVKFLSNGFDDVNFLNGVLGLQDLLEIGIESYDDASKILKEILFLPSFINQIHEMLKYLNLNEYLENFRSQNIHSLNDLRQIWEIELETVIKVSYLGHRKRLIACLDMLRQQAEHREYEMLNNRHNNNNNNKTSNQIKMDYLNDVNSSMIYSMPVHKTVKFADDFNFKQNKHESLNDENLNDFSNQTKLKSASNSDETSLDERSFGAFNSYTAFQSRDEQRSPKPVWQVDPQNLIRGSCNFVVQYLGSSALTKTLSNQDPIKYKIDRLKNTAKSTPYQSPKVELAISINGIKLLNYQTKEILWNHDIKHINNVCQDQDDLNYFAFSTQTDPNSYYYCHVFSCKNEDMSTQIILTIGQAFDLAYELFCKNNF